MERFRDVITMKSNSKEAVLIRLSLLFMIQPILDITSFFVNDTRFSAFSTGLRFLLLVYIIVYTTLYSRRNKYWITITLGSIIFFIFHMVGNYTYGPVALMSNLNAYTRVIIIPYYILFFYEQFNALRNYSSVKSILGFVTKLMVINLLIISVSIGLSYILGNPSFTYYNGKLGYFGVKGWFLVANSQSAIITVLSCFTLHYAINNLSSKIVTSLGLIILATASMYFFGTKLALYTIFLFLGAYFIILLLGKELTFKKAGVIIIVIATVFFAKNYSPSNLNNTLMDQSFDEWQTIINEMEENNNNSNQNGNNNSNSEPIDFDYFDKNRTLYTDVYNLYLQPLVDAFGIDAVAKEYNYSLESGQLINNRLAKITASKLSFNQGSTLNKMFGMQQDRYFVSGENYDVENDFHGMFYSYGYIGFAILIISILYITLRSLLSYLLSKTWRFNVLLGVNIVLFVFLLGASHYSGNVMKRPNVTFYLSVIVASMLFSTESIKSILKRKGN